ncbi:uncharacterized protein LOC131841358 [Achroia grisella]|uniref:uncharacterized protein LOC131841358 n=1 Tax=Achroia grisella TaxID=688607 RepID=UPI0027D31B4E|nr:uncharacterized protein LOC131841358 [Achroia grisella]
MPKVIRSPPVSEIQHTMSDSDVASIKKDNPAPVFQMHRSKRRRGSPEDKYPSDDIKNMMSEWKESQNTILNKLVADVAVIKLQNSEIKESNKDIEKSLEFISYQYEDMRKKVELLENERKCHITQIAVLENKVEEMQRTLKSSSIEIRNLPILKMKKTKEELCNIVQNTCRAINAGVSNKDIKDVVVLNERGDKSTIVAEFTTSVLKYDVIRSAKEYNKKNPSNRLNTTHIGLDGQISAIYISESLTRKARRLFYLARDVAKSENYKYCWSNNGKIYLRKSEDSRHIEIKDETQLTELKSVL